MRLHHVQVSCPPGGEDAAVHVGVEDGFTPARRAHPAFLVDDLDATAVRLEGLGFVVDRTEEHTFPGHRRVHTADGCGNRVELLAVHP